jgi:hypothetical protein
VDNKKINDGLEALVGRRGMFSSGGSRKSRAGPTVDQRRTNDGLEALAGGRGTFSGGSRKSRAIYDLRTIFHFPFSIIKI